MTQMVDAAKRPTDQRLPWMSSSPIPSLSASSLSSSIPSSPLGSIPLPASLEHSDIHLPSGSHPKSSVLPSVMEKQQQQQLSRAPSAAESATTLRATQDSSPHSSLGRRSSHSPAQGGSSQISPSVSIGTAARPVPTRAMSSSAATSPYTRFRQATSGASIWPHESSPSHNRVHELREDREAAVGVIGGSRSPGKSVEDRPSGMDLYQQGLASGLGGPAHLGLPSGFRDAAGRPWENGGSRSNSFSVGERRSSPIESNQMAGGVPSSPSGHYPTTFSDTSSPPPSPPQARAAPTGIGASRTPPVKPVLSRSRSQSMATGLRPTLGSGLIPMPMSALKSNEQTTPWGQSDPTTSNASPFVRSQRGIITHAGSFDAFSAQRMLHGGGGGDNEGFEGTQDRWQKGAMDSATSTHDRLTDSVHAALGGMHAYNPHHGTAAFEDPSLSNGGLSGSSSRRHSISIASGSHARRGFSTGYGFSEATPSNFGSGMPHKSKGFADEDFLGAQFSSALNLQLNEASNRLPAAQQPAHQRPANEPRLSFSGGNRFGFGQNGNESAVDDASGSFRPFVPPRMGPATDARSGYAPYPQQQRQQQQQQQQSIYNPSSQAIGSALLNPESSPYVNMNRPPNGPNNGQMRPAPATYAMTPNGIPVYGPGPAVPVAYNGGRGGYPQNASKYSGPQSQAGPYGGPGVPGGSFVGSIGSGPMQFSGHNPLNELGKGIPLSMVSPETPLFIVEFKAQRTDLFYCLDRTLSIKVGDYVIVEADRGQDLGKVTNCTITLDEVRQFAAYRKQELANLSAGLAAGPKVSGTFAGLHAGLNMMGQQQAQAGGSGGASSLEADDMPGGMQQSAAIKGLSKEIMPKRIFGKAGPQDQQLVAIKEQDERQALEICKAKVLQRRLPMEVLDAEYQWDRRKLTFYFLANKRIDFRDLVKELFRLHKTRIWMACLGGLYLEPGSGAPNA